MFKSVSMGARVRGGALVVGHFEKSPLDRATRKLDAGGTLAKAAKRPEATGESGRIVEAFPTSGPYRRFLLVGLGSKDSFNANSLRNLAAPIARKLAATRDPSVTIDFSGPLAAAAIKSETAGIALGEGFGLVAWSRELFKGSLARKDERPALKLSGNDKDFESGLRLGLKLAESANLARTLSETPPNIATPMYMAAQAQKVCKDSGMSCRVIKGDALVKERLAGLVNVGKASENEPCLIRMEYRPKGAAKDARPIVLVGKTLCYDSGGLSLKINNSMRGMKRDKDGGCAVLGAMHAIGSVVKPNVPVVALLAAAENAISDEAFRPDDIITYRNGVTVEVTNTDAEGRLVLADALCWACELENPACVIDLATLTGGVVTALGSTYCGMWCDDDDLRAKIEAASAACDERVWRLPLHQEYKDMMKSQVADIINSNPNRKAHPIQGAAFLAYFVKPGIPWCHLDIAGVHEVEGATGPFVEGPTGWGTRLLANFLMRT